MRKALLTAALATAAAGGSAAPALAAEVNLFRFFGDCANQYGAVTDLSKASGECGIIQVLTNKFNAENAIGAKVVTQTADWRTYYDLLSATYSTGNIPDIAVVHRSVLPNFAARGLVEPLAGPLGGAGVDFADFVPAAREAVTLRGETYAMPFDIHAVLTHINVDLMRQAGLVDGAGEPVLPTSPEELLAHGRRFKEATGKTYLAMESDTAGAMGWRLFESLVWQQGADVIAPDGRKSSIDTPEGLKAAELLKAIHAEGLSNKAHDYAGAEQAFLNGEAGLLVNGTWVVDDYAAQAAGGEAGLRTYKVANLFGLFGEDATWSDSHTWTVPTDANRPAEEKEAALAFLRFINDHNQEWARTGHLAVRQSVLDSEPFKALPHRSEYADTSKIARSLPAIQNQRGIQDVMVSELGAIWLTGADPKAVLAQMQARVDQTMRRSRN